MILAEECIVIFTHAIEDYHLHDDVDRAISNPYEAGSIEAMLYQKNWIDTVQWHLEDIVRDPDIDPNVGMEIKRRIDKSNQHRTDLVEQIDDWYNAQLAEYQAKESARLNTESIGWVVDRISILCLKLYHMEEQTLRTDVSDSHLQKCKMKLSVLQEQKADMIRSYTELIEDIQNGSRTVKVYRQMKMYNDDSLNPVLYTDSAKYGGGKG